MGATTADRRRAPRAEFPTQLAVNFLEPRTGVSVDGVNLSEGGLCLRLQEALEVKSLVRGQVSKGRKPVRCTGRVAWVIQRLDLRTAPPFLFDVGIEFVDPPPLLRQLLSINGMGLAAMKQLSQQVATRGTARQGMAPARASKKRQVVSAQIRGREFVAKLEQEVGAAGRWHLVVLIDEIPCFSGHYASERSALEAWGTFKRSQGKRSGTA